MHREQSAETPCLYYDGQCPFCRLYSTYVSEKHTNTVVLQDARKVPAEINGFKERGYDINDGILLKTGERIIQGTEALQHLEQYLESRSLPDRIRRFLCSKPALLGPAYVVLQVLRRIVLFILRRKTAIE